MIWNFARGLWALPLITLSIAILITSSASVASAQMTGTAQSFKKPSQALQHLVSAGSVESVSVGRPQNRRFDSGAMSLDAPPIFLPALMNLINEGIYAVSIAVADINGDGKPDMILVNTEVVLLLGNGDGTFQADMHHYYPGHYPGSVVVVDINGDEKPDLVMAGGNEVDVLLGNGDGTFQTIGSYPSGGDSAQSLAVADVNGDGKLDAVVANLGNGTLGVLLGNGDGTFRAPMIYTSVGGRVSSVAVADVNRDGKLDLLAANWCSAPCTNSSLVGVLLGNGDGTFQSAITFDSGGETALSIWAGDVNGDGKPDLQVASECQMIDGGCGPSVVGVLLGNGDGTFQPAVDYIPGGYDGHSLVVGDANGDGKLDLMVTSCSLDPRYCDNSDGVVSVLLGNGDGTFQPAVTYDSGAWDAGAIALADVNGDGRPDLLVSNRKVSYGPQSAVGVLLNNAGAPLTTTTMVSSANPAALHQIVTYTATVATQSGGVPTGNVKFQDGSRTIATVKLTSSQAEYSTKYWLRDAHLISATYTGDLNNAGSTSDTLTEYIQGSSKTVLTTSGSPSLVGQQVTITAMVSAKNPAGGQIPDGEVVTFYDGTKMLSAVPLSDGVARYTTVPLPANSHYIRAIYAGDPLCKPSHGAVMQLVEKYSTTTSLTSAPNPSAHGQAVTFTAAVISAGPTATGKVAFKDGATAIGTAALSGGVATLTKSKLVAGTHTVTAQYLGDAASGKSTSSVLNQEVQ